MQHLDGLEPEGLAAVEYPLSRPEQHRRDVEGELVDDSGVERLPNRGRTARDVDAAYALASEAASKPSVTKRKVVPPSISIGSWG